ncbi:TIGR00730 family Rossman fold protein [Breoghania sp.]|uniref:LOG family protein n=1 Tax=Breoghania sp. TaxID=2065378 RepID=UPI00262B0FD4|nr:TIGR00730 family Rossman fold protein [Breoghania sp.]MDJ0932147.1 TIGR00730 family Rossman fold protein [Breoghania sp.]
MTDIRSICVYCGYGPGNDPAYREAAVELGRAVAQAGIRLVYGGGSVGLMGIVARSVLDNGGKVTGIIPQFLKDREEMLETECKLIVIDDMHQRKRLMFEKADAFVALPDGIGTLEETVEMMTWAQLGWHHKPVLLSNIKGLWKPLHQFLEHMAKDGFIREDLDVTYHVVDEAADIAPHQQNIANGKRDAYAKDAVSISQL